MAEMLRTLPADHPDRPRIMAGYKLMMAALLKYQDADGMWRELLDHPEAWPESSSSAMFSFALISGVKHGWLDASHLRSGRPPRTDRSCRLRRSKPRCHSGVHGHRQAGQHAVLSRSQARSRKYARASAGLVGSLGPLARREVSSRWQIMRDEHHNVKPTQQPIFVHDGLSRVVYAYCRAAASHGRHGCFWTDNAHGTQPALRNPANSAILRCWVV